MGPRHALYHMGSAWLSAATVARAGDTVANASGSPAAQWRPENSRGSAMSYPTLRLKSGREPPIVAGHPWVFSGAFQAIPATLQAGEVVGLVFAGGEAASRADPTV